MSDSGSVPVVDVSPFLGVDPAGKWAVACQIAAACEDSGFFCITGHGIDWALIARTWQAASAVAISGAHLSCVLPSAQL